MEQSYYAWIIKAKQLHMYSSSLVKYDIIYYKIINLSFAFGISYALELSKQYLESISNFIRRC